MRQLTPVTNLVLACLAAASLIPVLGLPFFAAAQPYETDGIERNGEQVGRWFTKPADPITGTEALGGAREILLAIAALTVVLCMLMAVGPLRHFVRDLIKVLPAAAPVLVALHLFNQPAGDVEIRWGLFVGIAAAAFMASSAFHASRLPDPKPAPKPYSQTISGSAAPPGR